MLGLISDIRYALRVLRRSPGFAITVVLTLALGIGANTTIFSVVDAVLLQPLGFQHPEQLVQIQRLDLRSGARLSQLSFPEYVALREGSRTMRSFGVFRYWLFNLSGNEGSEAVLGAWADDSLFAATLKVQPRLGSLFAAGGGPGAPPQVLLSDRLWRRRYAADPGIVGRTVDIDGIPTAVAGVLPPGFRFPDLLPGNTPLPSREPDIYVPVGRETDDHSDAGRYNYWVVARLGPGASLPAAGTEMTALTRRIVARFPGETGRKLEAKALKPQVVGDARQPLLVLFGAVALVLAHRLYQYRRAADHPADGPAAGAGCPGSPGRVPGKTGAPALRGGPAARRAGRCGGRRGGRVGHPHGPVLGARHHSATGRGGAELAHAALRGRFLGIAALLFGVLPALPAAGTRNGAARDRTMTGGSPHGDCDWGW